MVRARWPWILGGVGAIGLLAGGIVMFWPSPSATTSPVGPTGPPWFEDVTDSVGLSFTHDPGPVGSYFMPQIIGSGAALFDFDNDGRLDIYLIQNGGPRSSSKNRLFRQREDGRFDDVSAGSAVDISGHGMGVAAGDVNNDGRVDLVVTEFRGVRLFSNVDNRTFAETTKVSGLDDVHWASSASFFDYDRDGWLDFVVVHYVDIDPSQRCPGTSARFDFCHPRVFANTAIRLYRNLGPQSDGTARFRDVSIQSRVASRVGPALGVLCADFDGDGWPDIFVANDSKANHLWISERDGTFREEAVERGCAFNAVGQAEANMGVVFGDVDDDELPDLFVTHLTEETNTLWKQGPAGRFTDKTARSGLGTPLHRGTGFGVVLADFDLDSRSDLAIVNGRIARRQSSTGREFDWNDYAERNQIFANQGDGKFGDLSSDNGGFCATPRVGRGLCGGDVFNRGRIDLLATHIGGPAKLYRNVAPTEGHWLVVRAVLREWKRDAYGALVTVSIRKRQWTRLIQPGSSYLSSNDPRAHFGLGAADAVDAIRVTWPDGVVETFPGGPTDRHLTLRQGEGTKAK